MLEQNLLFLISHDIFYTLFLSINHYLIFITQFSGLLKNLKKIVGSTTSSIRRYKSMNSLNTATSYATSIDSIPSEVNQNDMDDVDEDDYEIVENTRL